MRLFIETKKWQAEVTTSKYDYSRKASRAGLHPVAELDSRTVFAIRQPRGYRSFRLGRYRVHFGRADCTRTATVEATCDCVDIPQHSEHERLPEFLLEKSGVCLSELANPDLVSSFPELPTTRSEILLSELPTNCSESTSTVHELPTPLHTELPMTPFALCNDVYELESQEPTKFLGRGYSVPLAEQLTTNEPSEFFDKWYCPSLTQVDPAEFAPVRTPINPLKLQIRDQISGTPDMISADQSTTPSLFSPVTPKSDAQYHSSVQKWPDVSPISASRSSASLIATPLDQLTRWEQCHGQEGEFSTQHPEVSVMASPPEFFANPTPALGNGYLNVHQGPCGPPAGLHATHGDPSDPQASGGSFGFEPPDTFANLHWRGFDNVVPSDNYFKDDSQLHCMLTSNLAASSAILACQSEEACSRRTHTRPVEHSSRSFQSDHWDQHDDHNLRSPQGSGQAKQNVDYPMEVCAICEAKFTGKYRKGNFARHYREKHSEAQTSRGKTCRECGKMYKRADARRKHEWKKHRIQDARPNKRRKEQ